MSSVYMNSQGTVVLMGVLVDVNHLQNDDGGLRCFKSPVDWAFDRFAHKNRMCLLLDDLKLFLVFFFNNKCSA